jgi:ubiquinone/menaquinone biosynthesis C-methylase UbiE
MQNVMSSSQLKTFWDKFQKLYTQRIAININLPLVAMCNLGRIKTNTNINKILELSCGPGVGLEHLINNLKSRQNEVEIYGGDISENMLQNSFDNLKENKEINLKFKENFFDNNSKLNVSLSELDNENLSQFSDKTFDVVISNMSLHLVTNPDKMLQESSRVLKDDGVALFSIWGRPENSPYFTLIPSVMKKLEIPLPENRSNFHLSKIEKLQALIFENGFKTFNWTYINVPFDIYDFEDFSYWFESPNWKDLMEGLNEETVEKIKQECKNQLDYIIKEKNGMFGFESIVMICKKN